MEKLDEKMFSNLKTPPVNSVLADKLVDHFEALEIISPTIPSFQHQSQAQEESKQKSNHSMNYPDLEERCAELQG